MASGFFDDIQVPFPRFASRAKRQPNILDRVLGLYGSDPNTHIPEGQRNEALRRGMRGAASALTEAGLAGVPMSAFERLNVAFEGAAGTGAQMAQEQRRREMQALLQSGSESDLELAMRTALASGDHDTARIISQHLSSMRSAKAAGMTSKPRGLLVTRQDPETGEWRQALTDPTTGAILADYGPVRPEAGVVVDNYNPETGVTEKVLVDRRTGRRISKVGETAPKAPGQYESEALSRLNQYSIALDNIEKGLEAVNWRAPSWPEWEAYNSSAPGFIRSMVSDEMQGLLQAQNVIVTQIAKEIGGVRGAASPSFRNVIARTYLVAPGDSETNMRQTLQQLRAMEEDLRRKASGAMTTDELRAKYGVGADIEALIAQDKEAGIYGNMGGFADEEGADIAPPSESLLGTWPEE